MPSKVLVQARIDRDVKGKEIKEITWLKITKRACKAF